MTGTDDDIRETLAHHERQLTAMDTRLGGVERVVSSVDHKLDRLIQRTAEQAAGKPGQVLQYVQAGLSMLGTMAFLVGCTVAAIVYVSSNANNSTINLLNWRMGQVEAEKRWQTNPVIVNRER
jgi:hypothetical protein